MGVASTGFSGWRCASLGPKLLEGRGNMRQIKPHPEPEFVVLCSGTQEWRTQAELIAKRGRPMLLIGPCDSDLHFLQELAVKYGLTEHADRARGRYLFWRVDAAVNDPSARNDGDGRG
jgi:hypothetical protein